VIGDSVSPLGVPDRSFPTQHISVSAVSFDLTGRWMATSERIDEITLWDFPQRTPAGHGGN
jgi:hypothetical protein